MSFSPTSLAKRQPVAAVGGLGNPDALSIVGIGTSAGGLEALEVFFARVPVKSGLAYIVVQHLNPSQNSMLAELLQQVTALSVREASEQMLVEANHVYVIPPNTEMSLSHGRLHLVPPAEPRGMRLPINVLFSSLAREQGTLAVGVVLSGMGSDGTLGLLALKAVGGLTVVQEPSSAQFDSMPRSALAAGCVDIVALPEDLPGHILACVGWPPIAGSGPEAKLADEPADPPADTIDSIFSLLRRRTRHDFSLYKPSTLHRRIARRMAIHGLPTLADYVRFLRQNPQEIDLLFKELLIGVTSFFRDAAVWQHLLDVALPALLARRGSETKFRAWVAGCSTGEEAYTLAIAFAEALQRQPEHHGCTLQIFASDLSPDAIATARAGLFPATISASMPAEFAARHFTAQGNALAVTKPIRDMVMFAQHDVVLDPPFTRLDILSCRNLLIYFDATLQRRLLPLFHYSLRPGGLLLLGSAETVGSFGQLFEPVEAKLRLYLRRQATSAAGPELLLRSFPPLSKITKEPPVAPSPNAAQYGDSLQAAADHVLLQLHAPPAVVVNAEGDIVYISGRTGKYLEPAAGKANWNFHAMVRDKLREPVAHALRQAVTTDAMVQVRGLELVTAGDVQRVDVTVQPLHEPVALQGTVMIVFRDVAAPPRGGRRKAADAGEVAYAAELQLCRDEIQGLLEENRASREKLQSANEELQSANEELQSANEELTTSKEEMQSMNEELQTVNTEMQSKLDDLALAQSDMKSLLNSTEIAMLFLDQDLNVRRFTDRAAKIINLRDSDIGRPLSDLTTSLQYPTLPDDAHETLRTLVFSEKQIQTRDQRWFSVRIMPYRRLDNVIDGAVITFVDITATKQVEATLRKDAGA
ncbi:MAG: two-component system CheB/CheR fusion protein [Hydrogenophaga sp.]|jgi:two-component system CheB/CheR fusion protein